MNVVLVLVVALLMVQRHVEADYIWHDDEIPYEAKASCRRGRSYYSNSITANDTDIDVASDVDSLLDYSNKDICFYCVCSVGGRGVGCIARDPVFCEYFRIIRHPEAARDRYRNLFQQDRPAYFRQLSYRLRRTMDEGIFDFMENGGDALCCGHPNGHRRNLHDQVRNKIRLMRRKVPKENMMAGSPGVGSGLDDAKCIPFVSEYNDCSDANACSGCTRCSCDEDGKWVCKQVFECPQTGDDIVDDAVLDNALHNLYTGVQKKKSKGPGSLVPSPPSPNDDLLLVPVVKFDFDEELRTLLGRQKRSVIEDNKNDTIHFYETVDDINEDTLKKSNNSGTIEARKVSTKDRAKLSRRIGGGEHYNVSDPSSLHIEYNQPHEFEHHVAENKVDSKHPLEDKINGLSHEEIHKILGNYSQNVKNSDLSKLVVNEMMRGREVIGDKNVKPLSNITFTPENDTLTAMAFIAGNLLNKLWDMEKDATEGSFETEELKHQKINDLLGLFKEPLSMRQENFLKNALEKLSNVIDKSMNVKNVSLCTNFEETPNKMNAGNCTEKQAKNQETEPSNLKDKNDTDNVEIRKKVTMDTLNKVNDVLNLIKKYEQVQRSLRDVKKTQIGSNHRKVVNTEEENLSVDENVSLNLFGNLLGTITKMLIPDKNGKRVTKKFKSLNLLRQDDLAKKNIENLFNIDFGNRTMSSKDKMIMDYLSNIERHPNCFFSHLQKPAVTPISSVEGSILYNLSEFFKIKSFADLLNLINDKPDGTKLRSTLRTTTSDYTTSTTKGTTIPNLEKQMKTQPVKQESVQEKLKNDLKTILQDLVELQAQHGIKTNNKINIADALPCIYNVLSADSGDSKDNLKNKPVTSLAKIKSLIDSLKLDMLMSPHRRSNDNMIQRPKSAVVWERAIINLDKRHKPLTRRNQDQKQKSYTELKEMMDVAELSSSSYKNFAIQSGIAPTEKLVLLKTLQADVKQYTNILDNIQRSFETVTNLPAEKQNEFKEFVDSAAMNINLNKKVVNEIEKSKGSKFASALAPKIRTHVINSKQPLIMPKWADLNDNNNFKLRRDQIMNQLIINRLKHYIKIKERSEADLNSDTNYNIAKRIIHYIENGNIFVAKELFKVFVGTRQEKTNDQNRFSEYQVPANNRMTVESKGPKLLAFKEPLIRVEDPTKVKILTQDYFLKQLWNLKDFKE